MDSTTYVLLLQLLQTMSESMNLNIDPNETDVESEQEDQLFAFLQGKSHQDENSDYQYDQDNDEEQDSVNPFLPVEVLIQIALFLPVPDLGRCALVSRDFNIAIKQDCVWEYHLRQLFRVLFDSKATLTYYSGDSPYIYTLKPQMPLSKLPLKSTNFLIWSAQCETIYPGSFCGYFTIFYHTRKYADKVAAIQKPRLHYLSDYNVFKYAKYGEGDLTMLDLDQHELAIMCTIAQIEYHMPTDDSSQDIEVSSAASCDEICCEWLERDVPLREYYKEAGRFAYNMSLGFHKSLLRMPNIRLFRPYFECHEHLDDYSWPAEYDEMIESMGITAPKFTSFF